jgi:hypothetical protein
LKESPNTLVSFRNHQILACTSILVPVDHISSQE